MNLRFLETFVAVARLRSFTSAAASLNTTQAAISGRIAALERSLGISLFERSSRSVTLTAQGELALPHAEAVLQHYRALQHAVAPTARLPVRIRIAAGASIAQSFLPAFLKQLADEHPEVTIELVTAGSAANAAVALLADRVDLAMLLGPVPQAEVENVDLCRFAVRWVASPRLRLPAGPLELRDLAAHLILSFPEGSAPHRSVQGLFHGTGLHEVRFHALQSMATAVRLACDGVGVAALPPAILGQELAQGVLVLLETAEELPPLRFTASFKRRPDDALLERMAQMARTAAAEFCLTCEPSTATAA